MKHFILQIANPYSEKPSLKFATVPSSYTQVTLKKYFPGMFNYMRKYSVYNETAQAIKAVKDGWVFSFLSELCPWPDNGFDFRELDAFIYDGTVLNYLATHDEECRLLQVGSWSAMTGYALAFPHHSKFKHMFDDKILELRENGTLKLPPKLSFKGHSFFRWFGAVESLLDEWNLQAEWTGKKSLRAIVHSSILVCFSLVGHWNGNFFSATFAGAFLHEISAKSCGEK